MSAYLDFVRRKLFYQHEQQDILAKPRARPPINENRASWFRNGMNQADLIAAFDAPHSASCKAANLRISFVAFSSAKAIPNVP